MANRVLVIGVGTTGYSLCEEIANRVDLEWGGLAKTPWLEVLAYETKDITASQMGADVSSTEETTKRLLTRGLARRWFLDHNEIEDLKRRMLSGQLPPDIDPDVIERMKPLSPGAGNLRQAGRVIFLGANNSVQFYNDVRSALGRLRGLTNKTASDAAERMPDGSEASIVLDRPGQARPIEVYLVGHAAGGTASGTLIDLGYFIKAIARESQVTINLVALIILPPTTLQERNQVANAYALLREINHYNRKGAVWRGGFPHVPGFTAIESAPGEGPFNTCSVSVPAAGEGSANDSRVKILSSMGQFLYHVAMTDMTLDDRFVNPEFHRPYGAKAPNAPERMSSLCLASIQFPAPLIFKGCTAKLTSTALERWLKNTFTAAEGKAEIKRLLAVNPSDMVQKDSSVLSKIDSTDDLSNVAQVAKKANAPSAVLTKAWNDKFSVLNSAAEKGSEAVDKLAAEIESRVVAELEAAHQDLTRGPNWSINLLDTIEGALDEFKADQDDAVKRDSAAKRQQDNAISMLRDAEDSKLLAFLGAKRLAFNYWIRMWQAPTATRVKSQVGTIAARNADALKERLIGDTARSRGRLLGVIRQRLPKALALLRSLQSTASAAYRDCNTTNFSLNGHSEYTPGKDIDERYSQGILTGFRSFGAAYVSRHKEPEEVCQAVLLSETGSILRERNLFSMDASAFDTMTVEEKGQMTTSVGLDIDRLRERARPLFQSLFAINVLDLLYGRDATKANQIISATLTRDAKPFVNLDTTKLSAGAPAVGLDGAPVAVMFPEGGAPDNVLAAKQVITDPMNGIQQIRGIDPSDPKAGPNVMLFVQGRTLFSVAAIQELERYKEWYKVYTDVELSAKSKVQVIPGMHVMHRIVNVSPELADSTDQAKRKRLVGLFLTCLANQIIEFPSLRYVTQKRKRKMGEIEFRFPRSLDEVVDVLFDDDALNADMQEVFMERKGSDVAKVATFVGKIAEFQRHAANYGLKQNMQVVTSEDVHELLRPFLNREQLWQQYCQATGLNPFVHTPVGLFEANEQSAQLIKAAFTVPGFYCCNCGTIIKSFASFNDARLTLAASESSRRSALEEHLGRLVDEIRKCETCNEIFSSD